MIDKCNNLNFKAAKFKVQYSPRSIKGKMKKAGLSPELKAFVSEMKKVAKATGEPVKRGQKPDEIRVKFTNPLGVSNSVTAIVVTQGRKVPLADVVRNPVQPKLFPTMVSSKMELTKESAQAKLNGIVDYMKNFADGCGVFDAEKFASLK